MSSVPDGIVCFQDCAFIVMFAFEVHPEAHQFVEKVVMPCGVVLIISIFIAYEWEKVTRLQWLSEHRFVLVRFIRLCLGCSSLFLCTVIILCFYI